MKRLLLDTNILLRFITGEPADQAGEVADLMAAADAGKVRLAVLPMVLAEAVFVLSGFYEHPRSKVAEVLSQLRDEARIRGPEIQRELLGKANRQPFARLQLAFFERQMNLRDRLFVEPLTRRRRVTCEESGVAVVQRRDLEPRQLLDPARHDTFLMARCEEREVTGEGFGDQRLEVESLTLSRFAAIHIVRGHASFSLVAARLRRGPQYIANARAAPVAA